WTWRPDTAITPPRSICMRRRPRKWRSMRKVAGAGYCGGSPPPTAGRGFNPLILVRQTKGGLSMGFGSRLHEEKGVAKNVKVRNPSFLDYHLVTSLDVPKMIPIIVECPEPEGPYGAKGLGEPGLAPTPAAIGNAVADALGVRVYDLPLKPENVYWAVQNKKKKDAA